jgi:hypothetical protein
MLKRCEGFIPLSPLKIQPLLSRQEGLGSKNNGKCLKIVKPFPMSEE